MDQSTIAWLRPVSRTTVAVNFADLMTSKPTDWIDNSAISVLNHAAANYRSFKVIYGFMTHIYSVTHLDPHVKLFEQTQQKIMQIYRGVDRA